MFIPLARPFSAPARASLQVHRYVKPAPLQSLCTYCLLCLECHPPPPKSTSLPQLLQPLLRCHFFPWGLSWPPSLNVSTCLSAAPTRFTALVFSLALIWQRMCFSCLFFCYLSPASIKVGIFILLVCHSLPSTQKCLVHDECPINICRLNI